MNKTIKGLVSSVLVLTLGGVSTWGLNITQTVASTSTSVEIMQREQVQRTELLLEIKEDLGAVKKGQEEMYKDLNTLTTDWEVMSGIRGMYEYSD